MNQSNNRSKKRWLTSKGVSHTKGFTLIELIVVIIILGILAAIAIPKYLDTAMAARLSAVRGALAALQSNAAQAYSQQLINGSSTGTSWNAAAATNTVGDFAGSITGAGPQVTVTVTSGPTGWNTGVSAANQEKNFNLW